MKNDKKPKKCKAKTNSGARCRSYAGPSGFCFVHDPARQAEAAEARSRGGTKAGVVKAARKLSPGGPFPFDLKGPADVVDMLKAVAVVVWEAPTTARFDVGKKARTIAAVSAVLLKAYELTEYDARLSALESKNGV